VVKKIHTGGRPHNTTASRDGRWMYLSPMGAPRRVTIVDVEAGHEVAGHIPFSDSVRPPALSADNRRFFQNVDGLIGFEVADIASRKVIARIEHRIPDDLKGKPSRSHGLAIRPDQKEIWSSNVEHRMVHVHDMTRPDYPQTAAIPMAGRVYWLCFSPDSKYAYIAVRSERKVCVVDARTKEVLAHIEVGNTPKRNLVITLPEEKPVRSP
jgi:DNA-binding beta-propeller fold protein YncE